MRFGLIGDHPDGRKLTHALAELGRYELVVYAGTKSVLNELRQAGHAFELAPDVESLLVIPQVEMVIIADELAHRGETLRRAVQSDKHVLCVHPPDVLPDITYETAIIQQETRKLLLPMLSWRLSPAVRRLRELLKDRLGEMDLLQWERSLPASSLGSPAGWDRHPLVDSWDLLRFLGGEVRDVSAVGSEDEALLPNDLITVTGRFEEAGQYRVLLSLPRDERLESLLIRGEHGEATLTFHPSGTSSIQIHANGDVQQEDFLSHDAIRAFAVHVDACLAGDRRLVLWQDATRCLELFEAARSSVKRRRVIPMYYEEFTETSGFKGVMTSLGCGVLLLALGILVSLLVFKVPLKPWILGVVLPLLGIFLLLQALRWIVPQDSDKASKA
jgi:predicted dehydrogenase